MGRGVGGGSEQAWAVSQGTAINLETLLWFKV